MNNRTFVMSNRFIVLFLDDKDRLHAIEDGKDNIKKFSGIKAAEKAAYRLPQHISWTIREL